MQIILIRNGFNELKSIVENRGCPSILQLHLNIQHIIKNWPLPEGKGEETRQELALYHRQVMEEVFPWFDLQEPSRHWAEWQPLDENKLHDLTEFNTPFNPKELIWDDVL